MKDLLPYLAIIVCVSGCAPRAQSPPPPADNYEFALKMIDKMWQETDNANGRNKNAATLRMNLAGEKMNIYIEKKDRANAILACRQALEQSLLTNVASFIDRYQTKLHELENDTW